MWRPTPRAAVRLRCCLGAWPWESCFLFPVLALPLSEARGDLLQKGLSAAVIVLGRGKQSAGPLRHSQGGNRVPWPIWRSLLLHWASLVAQTVKDSPVMQETWVRSLGQEDPLEKGKGYPLQYSCLENSMDRGAWWATVHGLQRVRHD